VAAAMWPFTVSTAPTCYYYDKNKNYSDILTKNANYIEKAFN